MFPVVLPRKGSRKVDLFHCDFVKETFTIRSQIFTSERNMSTATTNPPTNLLKHVLDANAYFYTQKMCTTGNFFTIRARDKWSFINSYSNCVIVLVLKLEEFHRRRRYIRLDFYIIKQILNFLYLFPIFSHLHVKVGGFSHCCYINYSFIYNAKYLDVSQDTKV